MCSSPGCAYSCNPKLRNRMKRRNFVVTFCLWRDGLKTNGVPVLSPSYDPWSQVSSLSHRPAIPHIAQEMPLYLNWLGGPFMPSAVGPTRASRRSRAGKHSATWRVGSRSELPYFLSLASVVIALVGLRRLTAPKESVGYVGCDVGAKWSRQTRD